MMLSYHLSSEMWKGKDHLTIGLGGSWTLDELKRFPKREVERQGFQSALRYSMRILGSQEKWDRLIYPLEDSFDLLKELASSGRLFYQNKKVVVDPFCQVDYADGRKWKLKDLVVPFSESDWVADGDPSWVLHGGIIRAFSGEIPEEKVEVEPLPLLSLADRHGAFANLLFDYGELGVVAAHDGRKQPWRNVSSEKGWEQDLLETDFIKKQIESSHYYCPLDQVASSLSFLLEIGWKIRDVRGRSVERQTGADLDGEVVAGKVNLRGEVRYGEHTADLESVMGAFNRQERFVDLGEEKVALIDAQQLSSWQEAEDLFEVKNVSVAKSLEKQLEKVVRQFPTLVKKSSFQGTLFPYQQQGMEWLQFLSEMGWGGLLADEMGLGKTVQLIAFLGSVDLLAPVLVVVPTSLLFNWEKEFRQFLPTLPVSRYEGEIREGVNLISYAKLRLDIAEVSATHYQLVVLDEAQTIKNSESQVAKACKGLRASMRVAITGTPVENRLEELSSLFEFAQPDLLPPKKELGAHFSHPLYLARLGKRLRPFMRRRTKKEVALDLPEKLEQTVFVEMSDEERELYEGVLKRTREKVFQEGSVPKRMEVLEAILRLRQCCVHPRLIDEEVVSSKCERLLSDLQEVVDEGRKVLVYSQFTSMLKHLECCAKKRGWKYAYLDGSTSDREAEVEKFQENDDVSIFFISLKAGGVGLNLTAADYVFLYDPWWNVAVENQAIDRAHRLGRKEPVIVRRYVMALSIEEKMMTLKEHKRGLSEALFEAVPTEDAPSSLDDLVELIAPDSL